MRRYNRIITLLLALCMIFTMLPAGAMAVTTGETGTEKEIPASLLDALEPKTTVVDGDGPSIQEIEKPENADLKRQDLVKLPASVDELRPDDTDMVRVMVVLEGASLLEDGYSTKEIAARSRAVVSDTDAMLRRQEALLEQIETVAAEFAAEQRAQSGIATLDGAASAEGLVEVTYNFTMALNGMALQVPYGILDDIRGLDSVASAFLSPRYDVPENMSGNVSDPNMYETKNGFGTALTWNNAGYKGEGMTIAVIDTGLDLDHPSFADAPENPSMTAADIEPVLTELNAYKKYAKNSAVSLTTDKLYRSEKVPFGFNYVDSGLDITHDHDTAGDHGTHVAGIATANEMDSTDVVGVAPEAQLLVMKVFGANGGAYFEDTVAAVEDCIRLDVDAVNLSLGSPGGFVEEAGEAGREAARVYSQILNSDMVVSISAGNSYSAAFMNGIGTNRNFAEDPDIGIVSSPSTYVGATTVASVENGKMMLEYLEAGGKKLPYNSTSAKKLSTLAGQALEYVMVPGYGEKKDYEGLDLKGRVAVVSRGGGEAVNFVLKQDNALAAGAVACLVYDNVEGNFINMIDNGKLPHAFLEKASGAYLKELAGADGIGTLTFSGQQAPFENIAAGEISEFSSWGVTPDLQLSPDVTAPGGNIYSTVTDGKYDTMSGTSMASPHIAGMSALLLQYLREKHPELTNAEMHAVAESLIMSTAVPLRDPNGVIYSPRLQGAGSANVYSAVTSPVYLTSQQENGEVTPKASMGDNDAKTGEYHFSFDLHNFGTTNQTYLLDGYALTDRFLAADGQKYIGEQGRNLDAAVTFAVNGAAAEPDSMMLDANQDGVVDMADVQFLLDGVNGLFVLSDWVKANFDLVRDGRMNTADVQRLYELIRAGVLSNSVVTVSAGSTVSVDVTVRLSQADMQYMDANYPNGIYVDGFVRCYAQSDGGVDLSLPFVGFHGDWSAARTFDPGWYYQDGVMENYHRYPNTVFVTMGADPNSNGGLGLNPYVVEDYSPAHNVLSPNGDMYYDYISEMYFGMLRGSKLADFTWKDAEGNVLDYEWYINARKSFFVNGLGVNLPMIYSDSCDPYTFRDENGNLVVEDGDQLTLTVRSFLDDGDLDAMTAPGGVPNPEQAWSDETVEMPVVIDMTAPYVDMDTMKITEENGRTYLYVDVHDNYDIAAVVPMTLAQEPLEYFHVDTKQPGDAGESDSLKIDITEYGASFILAVCDYGCNETYYEISNSATSGLREDQFYAFRRYSCPVIGGTMYMTDQLNGWYSFRNANEMSRLTSQPMTGEPAVYAAEYVDGYIFGAENGGKDNFGKTLGNRLFMMKAGSWERSPLKTMSLEKNQWPGEESGYTYTLNLLALDMAFDYTTDTMYMLANAAETSVFEEGLDNLLVKVDVNSGSYELLGTISSTQEGDRFQALTLACSNDGTLYTINRENGKLYTIEKAGVKYEEITDYELRDFKATPVKYDQDNKYLPAAYTQSMTVDHKTDKLYWAAYQGKTGTAYFFEVDKATGAFVNTTDMADNAEMAGLFMPYNCGRDIVAGGELTGLTLNSDELYLLKGENSTLIASPDPLNAPMGEVTWSSADPAIATVHPQFGIVEAKSVGTTTVTATADGLTAECTVNVSEVSGTVIGFNGGSWHIIDAGRPGDSMTVTDPVTMEGDVQAAAYVHGAIYAAAVEDGLTRLYRLDPATLQSKLIGSYEGNTTALAFNYADGYMYSLTEVQEYHEMYDMLLIYHTLHRINLQTGETAEVADLSEVFNPLYEDCTSGAMAIDYKGNFYFNGILEGEHSLVRMNLAEDELSNVTAFADEGFKAYSSGDSMVYSDRNHGLLRASGTHLYWIDVEDMENVQQIDLGEIRGTKGAVLALTIALTGEPAVPKVQATGFEIEEAYSVYEGGVRQVSPIATPWNATEMSFTYDILDPTIATVDENGLITGVSQGTTTLMVTLKGANLSKTAEITVTEDPGTLYGYMLAAFATGNTALVEKWAQLPVSEPSNGSFLTSGTYEYDIYAGAYYDGYVYAYGQSNVDYRYYLLKIDPASWSPEIIAQGEYIVRDMAFDYSTGTMYAIVKDGGMNGGLAQVDLQTGEFTVLGDTGLDLVSMAITSADYMEEMPIPMIWTIDTDNVLRSAELDYLSSVDEYTFENYWWGQFDDVFSSSIYQSMTYDYNNNKMYWAQSSMFSASLYEVGLTEDFEGYCTKLGSPNIAGDQDGGAEVTSLFTIPKTAPEMPDEMVPTGVKLAATSTVAVGETVTLDAVVLPVTVLPMDRTVTWSSSDESIATVENGVVTGVAAGDVTITATDAEGNSADCEITVTEEARKFHAYDELANRWFTFDENGEVTYLCEAEDNTIVASTYVDGVLYAYDEDGIFYTVDTETFQRTRLGDGVSNERATLEKQDVWKDPIQPVEAPYTVVAMTNDPDTGKLYITMEGHYNSQYMDSFEAVITEVDPATGEPVGNPILHTDLTPSLTPEVPEYRPSNLMFKDGQLYFIDGLYAGMITSVDLKSGKPVQLAVIPQYWGDYCGSRSMIYDELTNEIYALRDMRSTWYGNTDLHEAFLYRLRLGNGYAEEQCEIGAGMLVGSMFIK